MDNIYENIEEYNPNIERKVLIVFDDIIADIRSNKRGEKLNISLIFIMQSYFPVPKNIRLNSTHYFIMKISNKQLQ